MLKPMRRRGTVAQRRKRRRKRCERAFWRDLLAAADTYRGEWFMDPTKDHPPLLRIL